MTNSYDFSQEPTITVIKACGARQPFVLAGLHEDVEYHLNIYTCELTGERVEYGPRGNDEWARLGSEVIATWPTDQWRSVTRQHRGDA